jgi:hypothetical protein
MSKGLILKMNNGYNGGEQSAREVHYVKREGSYASYMKGMGPFIDQEAVE